MSLNYFLQCSQNCRPDFPTGPIDQNQDCINYPVLDSQVSDLILVPFCAEDPFDWSTGSPVIQAGTIDNTDTTGTYSRRIVGKGGVPIPAKDVENLPRNRKVIHRRVYTLTLEVLNLSDDQYLFLKQLQCGWLGFTFYYLNLAGFTFGIQGGIKPLFMDVDFPLGVGKNEKQRAVITIEWEAEHDPARYLMTLTDDDFVPGGAGAAEAVGLPDAEEVIGEPDDEEAVGP